MAKTKKGVKASPARISKSEKRAPKSSRLVPILFTVGLLLFLISGITYYTQVYTKPSTVFWDMIDNNLITKGITRQVIQDDGETSSNEIAQFNFGTPTAVKLTRTLTGTNDPGNITKLEGLGLGDSDYQRYIQAERSGDGDDEQAFSKVLNQWVLTGSNDQSKGVESPSILLRSLLGPVLNGNLPAATRQSIINDMMAGKVYDVDYNNVKKVKEDGRSVYKFDTTVNLKSLITVMSKYAQAMGIPGAETVDPSSYQSSDNIKVVLVVDLHSRQLRKIEYADDKVKESYSGYGVTSDIEAPSQYLTSEEFRKLIGQ